MITVVRIHLKLRSGDFHRTSSSGRIRLAQFHADTADSFYPVIFIHQNLRGIGQQIKLHALFLCMVYFFHTGRQFRFASSVHDMYLRSETKRVLAASMATFPPPTTTTFFRA